MAVPDRVWFERILLGLGYSLVHVENVARGRLLRVYIEKGAGSVTVDDCAHVSEHLTRALTAGGFDFDRLEISSPGLDRPLAREEDFRRFLGSRARVQLRVPVHGRRRLLGTLRFATDGRIGIEVDGSEMSFELANVEKARLAPEL